MTFPFANQIDLHTNGPRIEYEPRAFGSDGYEKTERRTGATQCPCCGLWWPVIEEPDAWSFNPETLQWEAREWWGGVACSECDLLMIDQPDGKSEVYQLTF